MSGQRFIQLGVSVCVLCLIALTFCLYMEVKAMRKELSKVRRNNRWLKEDMEGLKDDVWQLSGNEDLQRGETSEEKVARALKMLKSDNVVARYEGMMMAREMETEQIVPHLIELFDEKGGRAPEAALLILNDSELSQTQLQTLREKARQGLAEQQAESKPSTESIAGLLAVLGKHDDKQAKPLFKAGMNHDSKVVRIAALKAIRDTEAVSCLEDALRAWAAESGQGMFRREAQNTIVALSISKQTAFFEQVDLLGPRQRFQLVSLLGKAAMREPQVVDVLKRFLSDKDQRVALAAAERLKAVGNDSGKGVVEDKLEQPDSPQIRALAESLLKEF